MSKKGVKNSKIVLVSHYRIYSASQALRDYLREKNCPFLLYISHPLPLKDAGLKEKSFCEISKGKKIIKSFRARFRFFPLFFSSFYEFFLTLFWVVKTKKVYDLFVGVDNLNALEGLILKKVGRVKKVVYYTIDYFPTRFENKLLNWLYHFIDKLCVRYADETWNVSSVMVEAREKYNHLKREIYPRQYTVPIGIWYEKAPRKRFSQINKKKLIFVGHLLPHMGVDLVIKALAEIIKEIPQVKLDIIGGGEEEERLKNLARKMRMEKRVKFHGWITERRELEEIMSKGAVGLAPFNTEILDEKVKNADPGKLKDYMLLGMPVVVTDAIANGEEIKKKKCGYVIKYKKEELKEAVVKLLKNKSLLRKYRENALNYVKQFDYPKLFALNLRRVLNRNNHE